MPRCCCYRWRTKGRATSIDRSPSTIIRLSALSLSRSRIVIVLIIIPSHRSHVPYLGSSSSFAKPSSSFFSLTPTQPHKWYADLSLGLSRSPSYKLPASIPKQATLALTEWRDCLRAQAEQPHDDGITEYLYKVLVIGDIGTGKTSIIKRYVHNVFSMHYKATVRVRSSPRSTTTCLTNSPTRLLACLNRSASTLRSRSSTSTTASSACSSGISPARSDSAT